MKNLRMKLLAAIAAFAFASPALAQQLQDGATFLGHYVVAGVPPTTTTCTLIAGSTDTDGGCSATATSGVAVIFAKPFATAPICVVLDHTTSSGNALATEPTTTTFVMGTTVSGDKITWHCAARSGN